MPCEDTMRESQRLALEQWKADQQAKCNRAYDPIRPPENALIDAFVAEIRRENAAKPRPDPICRRCHFPIGNADRDPLFRKLCATCAGIRLDKLLQRMRHRLGRKATVRALKWLAQRG